MTKVNIKKSEDTYCSKIVSSGHAGYSQEGSDIICAAISTAMELVIDMLDEFSVDFDLKCDEKSALIEIQFKQNDNNRIKYETIRHILDGYKRYIKDLSQEYPEYVTISTEV